MISVLLLHPSGREFSLAFPEADAFGRTQDAEHYQILSKTTVIGEVPLEYTLYIGTEDIQVGPTSSLAGVD